MTEPPTRKIEQEIRIDATPEEVLSAWTDPERIVQWFVDAAEGHAEPGKTVTWTFDGFGNQPLPVVDVVPGKRLVYAGEIPGRPSWALEITVRQTGGSTLLRLVNSGFLDGAEWDEEYEGTDSGWAMSLGQLKAWLEHHAPLERTHLLVKREAPYDHVVPLFTTAPGLTSWLAESAEFDGEELVAGTDLRLGLRDLGPLAGSVLVRTRRELLLSWPERRAVLGLKAFMYPSFDPESGAPTTPHPMVAVDVSAWGLSERDRAATENALGSAVERLAHKLSAAAR